MEMDWMDMVYYQKQVQKLTRLLLPAKQTNLTVSECELLAWLYQEPEQNTPVLLSQRSGMKKEAVSRCLKSLLEKNCIRKEKQPHDERSYKNLSDRHRRGRTAKRLQNHIAALLRPVEKHRRRF